VSLETYLHELADPTKPLAVSKLINLSSMGPEEASRFLNAWPGFELGQRQRLMQTLIDLAEDNVELNFDAVFFIAMADSTAEVRQHAIRGLWEHEGRDLIDPLIGLLQSDPDARVRAEAALALGRFVLQAEFATLRSAHAERVDQALRRTIEDSAEVAEVCGRALESLAAHDAPWVRDLIQQAFESSDRRLRLSALHAMGRSCAARWLPLLIPELASDDAEMRFEAAGACGAIADESATPHLLPLLRDEDEEVQEAAIAALGEISGAQAKAALEGLLQNGSERVREAAVAALAEVNFAEDPVGFKVRDDPRGE